MASLAEDLLLLAAAAGRLGWSSPAEAALNGAELEELALRDRISLARGRVVVADPAPTGDDDLDDTLAWLGGRGGQRRLRSAAGRHASRGRRYRHRLRAQEALERRRAMLVLHRDVLIDEARAQDVRMRVLWTAGAPDSAQPRDRALAALAHAASLDRALFPGREGRDARRALKELGDADPIAKAARDAAKAADSAGASVAATSG